MNFLNFLPLIIIILMTLCSSSNANYQSQLEISERMEKHHQQNPGKTMEPLNCEYISKNNLKKKAFIQNSQKASLIPFVIQYLRQRCDLSVISSHINQLKSEQSEIFSKEENFLIFHTAIENEEVFQNFVQGTHIANHIPGFQKLICDKDGLTAQLKQLDNLGFYSVNSSQFYPESYIIFNQTDFTEDGKRFFEKTEKQKEEGQGQGEGEGGDYWLTKDAIGAGGSGITLHRGTYQLKREIMQLRESTSKSGNAKNMKSISDHFREYSLVQKYIHNPLLVNGKHKIHERTFVVVLSTNPLVVVFKPFNIIISSYDFDLSFTKFDEQESLKHIINYASQVFSPGFKPESIMSIQQFQNYLLNNCSLPYTSKSESENKNNKKINTVEFIRNRQMEAIAYSLEAAQLDLSKKRGFFSILAVDFTFDENMNPWLLEFNRAMNIPYQYEQSIDILMRKTIQSTYDLVLKANQHPEGVFEFWKGMREEDWFDWNVVINEAQDFSVLNEYQINNEKRKGEHTDL